MKKFLTSYISNGVLFSGTVDAIDIEHAQQIAESLDPPQTVDGVIYAVVSCASWTDAEASKFTEAIACDGGEPPDAEVFD